MSLESTSYISPSTSFQSPCHWLACSCSCHIFLLSQLATLTIRNSLSLSLPAQDLPFWATVCKTVRPMRSDRCLSCPVCLDVRALWPNGWTDQYETRQAGRPRPWPHCIRWGPSSSSPKGHSPQFWPISVAAKWLHGSRCHSARSLPRPRRLGVRWGPWSWLPSPKRGRSPQIFGPCLLWPNGWMDQDGTWDGGRPQPRRLCVRWGPSPPPKFSAYVYYSYCDFVRTLHTCYWFVQVQVQVLVLVFYAFCFRKKSLIALSVSNINTETNTVRELNHWTSIHCSEFSSASKKI